MADYSRTPEQFFYRGLSLVPQDALAQGKVALAVNIRSYQEGTITVRWGLTEESSGAMPGPVHSLFRLNDTSLFGGGSPQRRFAGSGTTLYAGPPSLGAYNAIVTGQSGNPLTAVSAAPINSPRPYLYVADSVRMRKINSNLNDFPIGIDTPLAPPTATLEAVQSTFLETINSGHWVSYGSSTAPVGMTRIAATVTQINYDSGTTGFASIALDDMTGIIAGATVDLDTETVVVQDVIPPISQTTIGRILYDAGASGLCTIQPAGSFSAGQIEAALPDEIRRRYEDLNQPVPHRVTVSRTVDFPVNGLVTLSGLETVKILSVALGQDGKQSFRCVTVGTHVAGGAIVGVTCFRGSTFLTHTIGAPASALGVTNTLTPANITDPIVGGIQAAMSGSERNWGLVGTQASQPSDIIRFGIRVSQFAYLKSVRLMLDVDPLGGTPVTFLQNYYFYEWRANDLLEAVQATLAAPTTLISDAQAAAVTQGIVDAQYAPNYGSDPTMTGLWTIPGQSGTPGPVAAVPTTPNQTHWPYRGYNGAPTPEDTVTAGSAVSRQLSLGDNQWIILQCRVGDLTRVGTDATRTLSMINSAAYVVQAQGTTNALTFDFSDGYITGGYGPDVGTSLAPYVYRYRFRSTVTGERSNPSPSMRAGMAAHRGRIAVTPGGTAGAPQCDTIDWFRYGGALARWQYTGSQPNTLTPFNDDNADTDIDGGENLRTDLFQPWPSFDLPRTGTAILAGTSLQWVSGDTFNTNWAADSIIIVNTRATTLYRQPVDSTHLEVVDNCGDGATIVWSMPSPTLLAQALPAMWGGPVNNVWFHFACGAAADPSQIHWTHGNDPDATSDVNTLTVSSASEPLQNGCMYDGVPYVFSTEKLYRISPTFGQINAFRADETPCTDGLWSRWAMAVGPEGIYFLTKNAIKVTAGGSEAVSITDPDLAVLFPQDGGSPDSIRGLDPIDFTAITKLKLTYVSGFLYFDYQTINGDLRTLMYEPMYKRWTADLYERSGITARINEPGPQIYSDLVGAADGNVYQVDADQLSDAGTTVNWTLWTRWQSGEDLRALKQWGDSALNMNPGSSVDGITVTPVTENGNLAATTVGILGTVRDTFIIEVNAGVGSLSENFGFEITGGCQICDGQRPLLYWWEPSWLFKQVAIARRRTDWEDLGYKGAKFVQGIVLRANTFNATKLLNVQSDGGTTQLTLQAIHNGEVSLAYPLSSSGWTPFVSELVRIAGADDLPWTLLDWRWVWEPAPELATQWETQYTTFDMPGFLHVYDGVIAYQSTTPITWFIEYQDGSTGTYVLASSAGLYKRVRQITLAQKGKAVRFRWTADEPFRLFKRDMSVRVGAWGIPGGYTQQTPFGGPHRASGAEI